MSGFGVYFTVCLLYYQKISDISFIYNNLLIMVLSLGYGNNIFTYRETRIHLSIKANSLQRMVFFSQKIVRC